MINVAFSHQKHREWYWKLFAGYSKPDYTGFGKSLLEYCSALRNTMGWRHTSSVLPWTNRKPRAVTKLESASWIISEISLGFFQFVRVELNVCLCLKHFLMIVLLVYVCAINGRMYVLVTHKQTSGAHSKYKTGWDRISYCCFVVDLFSAVPLLLFHFTITLRKKNPPLVAILFRKQ